MSTESSLQHGRRNSSNDALDAAQWQRWLPPLLSVIAGMVDVIGFLSLKLFTAHVTGNLVVMAAQLVRGGPPKVALILAVPVFIMAVAGVWVIAKILDKHGPALAKPLLLVQFVLLACVLILSVIYSPADKPHEFIAGFTAMIAVSAMACQFALLRLIGPGAPSTAVMTGNLTNAVLMLLDTLSSSKPLMAVSPDRLKKTLRLLAGFFGGCLAGAAGFSWMENWAWRLPVLLAGLVWALAPMEAKG
jgi:uncharacterized membrane protein YoaK (UPF0700 family)